LGYKNNNPGPWQSKRMATEDDRRKTAVLCERSTRWNKLATWISCLACSLLGYRRSRLQSPQQWLDSMQKCLLADDQWSERRSILGLNAVRRLRSGLILMVIYLFAQHRRLQFQDSGEFAVRVDEAPFEELAGNHHNLDHQLLRTVCYFCGVGDEDGGTFDGLWARLTSRFMSWWFKPLKDIHRYTVMCWVRAADMAAGIAPRDPKTLDKTYVQTAMPAWKRLHERSLSHLPLSWLPNWHAAIFLFLAVIVSGAYPAITLARWLLRLLHF
jgi:hypothetical protein